MVGQGSREVRAMVSRRPRVTIETVEGRSKVDLWSLEGRPRVSWEKVEGKLKVGQDSSKGQSRVTRGSADGGSVGRLRFPRTSLGEEAFQATPHSLRHIWIYSVLEASSNDAFRCCRGAGTSSSPRATVFELLHPAGRRMRISICSAKG
jgi:hypothetical protein